MASHSHHSPSESGSSGSHGGTGNIPPSPVGTPVVRVASGGIPPLPPISAGSNTVEAASAPSGSSNRGKKRGTSWVWDHMSKQKDFMKDGQNIGVRAVCNYCPSHYSNISNNGTGGKERHLKNKHADKIKQGSTELTDFTYSHAEMRKGLARYVAAAEQPFTFGDDVRFENFVQTKINPAFKRVSRNTTRSDVMCEFNEQKAAFITEIASHPHGTTMSFTSDMWTGRNNRGYLALTAHYMDSSWELNKRIIAFRLVEYPHNAQNIFQTINGIFREYNVSHKVFSITFDNHTANTAAIALFKQSLSGFYGGEFFHMRCVCHIINLVVKDGLAHLGPQLDIIKHAISFISSSSTRQQEFDAMCASLNLKPKKLSTDVKNRWNSTYLMLKSCRKYSTVISDFINCRQHGGDFYMISSDWDVAFEYMKFFKVFYTATVALSGVRYPTSCLVLKHLYNISHAFRVSRSKINFVAPCADMEVKFSKYFDPIPQIFILAAVMDPKIKLRGVDLILKGISENLNITLPSGDDVFSKLNALYALYESKYGSNPLSNDVFPTENIDDAVSSLLSSTALAATSCTQLSEYLRTEYFSPDERAQDFDILGWWKAHEMTFPILHIMARDLLSPPASSVASESAFSAGKRVLDEKRSRLNPDILDCLICLKDWEDASLRIHPHSAKDEFRDYFADSDIDDD